MTGKKKLEDKILESLETSMEKLGTQYSPLIEALGFNLSYSISKIGLRDANAPKKEKDKFCLVAYICELTGGPKLHPVLFEHLKNYVLKDEFEGHKLYVEASGPIVAYGAHVVDVPVNPDVMNRTVADIMANPRPLKLKNPTKKEK